MSLSGTARELVPALDHPRVLPRAGPIVRAGQHLPAPDHLHHVLVGVAWYEEAAGRS